MLAVSHASVEYDAADGSIVPALQDVSLTIGDGEFVVALGPSGCGKSTLLGAIAGFVRLSAGAISVDGVPVTGPGADRAVVFQQDTLLPWASVLDNVAFGLRLGGLGRRARRARARELLDQVGLGAFADKAPYELSGGMRQRVGLARALAIEPPTLLMDEPLGALDSFTRETMQELILRLWSMARRRVLFITHSIEEALFMGTEIIVFSPRPGRIVARQPATYGRAFLAGRPAAAVKSTPDFVERREALRELIHRAEAPA